MGENIVDFILVVPEAKDTIANFIATSFYLEIAISREYLTPEVDKSS